MIAIVLVLWAFSGPIGMAFDGCAMMGAMCEAPCGMPSHIVAPQATGLVLLEPLSYLVPTPSQQVALIAARPPTPPPKFPLLSA